MDRPLTLAYSPCPNDTYVFAAWTNGLIEGAPPVRVALEDVESLNTSALKGDYELTKVSYGAVPLMAENYRILRSGGALGEGCGPLVIARQDGPSTLEELENAVIAIPGELTTAFMLLRLAMKRRPQILQLRFDKIVDAVARGVVDAGLIIHESRFTYQDHGLKAVADLGDWWEQETKLPIPLGAILIRNDLGDAAANEINDAIRASLRYARERESDVIKYVREHATEMDDAVMRKHIETYVTKYTEDVDNDGVQAVEELFRRAHEAGIMPESANAEFV